MCVYVLWNITQLQEEWNSASCEVTWRDLEAITLSGNKSDRENIIWFHLQVEQKKMKQLNKHNKTETDLQIQGTNRCFPEGLGRQGMSEIGEGD